MHPWKKEFIFMILQFLDDMKYKKTLHKLEQESKIFFNLKYFKESVENGELEKADKYLSAFTEPDDNIYSKTMIFLIRREKKIPKDCARNKIADSLEAMNSFWEVANRENLLNKLSLKNCRVSVPDKIVILVEKNPMLQEKLMFPNMKESKLWDLTFDLICFSTKEQTRIFKDSESNTKASLHRELIFIILQFLGEEKFTETLLDVEKESKIFFNTNYFEQCVINGEWCKSEEYLLAFTRPDNDSISIFMFFLIRKQKYFEALDSNDRAKANKVFREELKVFIAFKDYTDIIDELSELVLNKNFRQSKFLPEYVDTASARFSLRARLKILVEGNRILLDKFMFPSQDTGGLLARIKLNLNLLNVDNIFTRTLVSQPLCLDVNSSNSSTEKSAIWKHTEIKESSQCRTLVLLDESLPGRVARLIYSHSGDSLVGLTGNATHKRWKWQSNQLWKANANVPQKLYQHCSERTTNFEINVYPEYPVPSFALKTNDSYLISVSRGKFSRIYLQILALDSCSIMSLSPAATCLAILHQDDDTFALGFEDSSIKICCSHPRKIKAILEGHQKSITCLAFSDKLEVLVSSGADAQLCVWSTNGWKKQANVFLQTPNQKVPDPPGVSHIEFNKDQSQLLAVCENRIATYAAHNLKHLNQLVMQGSISEVTHATYSCDGQSIYATFKDGSVGVFVARTLVLRCEIKLTAYTRPEPSWDFYPLVIAAHPSEPNQFALGLNNGRVHVLEPLEAEGEWGIPPPPEDDKEGA